MTTHAHLFIETDDHQLSIRINDVDEITVAELMDNATQRIRKLDGIPELADARTWLELCLGDEDHADRQDPATS